MEVIMNKNKLNKLILLASIAGLPCAMQATPVSFETLLFLLTVVYQTKPGGNLHKKHLNNATVKDVDNMIYAALDRGNMIDADSISYIIRVKAWKKSAENYKDICAIRDMLKRYQKEIASCVAREANKQIIDELLSLISFLDKFFKFEEHNN